MSTSPFGSEHLLASGRLQTQLNSPDSLLNSDPHTYIQQQEIKMLQTGMRGLITSLGNPGKDQLIHPTGLTPLTGIQTVGPIRLQAFKANEFGDAFDHAIIVALPETPSKEQSDFTKRFLIKSAIRLYEVPSLPFMGHIAMPTEDFFESGSTEPIVKPLDLQDILASVQEYYQGDVRQITGDALEYPDYGKVMFPNRILDGRSIRLTTHSAERLANESILEQAYIEFPYLQSNIPEISRRRMSILAFLSELEKPHYDSLLAEARKAIRFAEVVIKSIDLTPDMIEFMKTVMVMNFFIGPYAHYEESILSPIGLTRLKVLQKLESAKLSGKIQ